MPNETSAWIANVRDGAMRWWCPAERRAFDTTALIETRRSYGYQLVTPAGNLVTQVWINDDTQRPPEGWTAPAYMMGSVGDA